MNVELTDAPLAIKNTLPDEFITGNHRALIDLHHHHILQHRILVIACLLELLRPRGLDHSRLPGANDLGTTVFPQVSIASSANAINTDDLLGVEYRARSSIFFLDVVKELVEYARHVEFIGEDVKAVEG